jgi:low temperature requirement protein LtrA
MRRRPPAPVTPEEVRHERATFLELFFDLVFVFALTRIATRAFEDLALEPGGATGWAPLIGGANTLLLILPLWAVWQATAWTTSRYDPYWIWLQLIVVIAIVGTMVMGVAIPRAYHEAGLAFAVGYVSTQVARPLILLIALRADVRRHLKLRMLIVHMATGVFWIAGALVSIVPRVILWVVALAAEYLAARTGWPVPWLGRSGTWKWEIGGAHFAERYQQFLLIALGEAVLITGLAYSQGNFARGRMVAFGLALATAILMWRIYIQRAGQILGEAVEKAAQPAKVGRSAADTHLIMVIGIIATGIGFQLAIAHPFGRPEPAWVVMILGGPAVFLAGRSRFEHVVFSRVSPSRLVCIGALLVLLPLLLRAASLFALAAGTAILLAVALIDMRRAWGRAPEPAAPPY